MFDRSELKAQNEVAAQANPRGGLSERSERPKPQPPRSGMFDRSELKAQNEVAA
jgi:hypothetical protein